MYEGFHESGSKLYFYFAVSFYSGHENYPTENLVVPRDYNYMIALASKKKASNMASSKQISK